MAMIPKFVHYNDSVKLISHNYGWITSTSVNIAPDKKVNGPGTYTDSNYTENSSQDAYNNAVTFAFVPVQKLIPSNVQSPIVWGDIVLLQTTLGFLKAETQDTSGGSCGTVSFDSGANVSDTRVQWIVQANPALQQDPEFVSYGDAFNLVSVHYPSSVFCFIKPSDRSYCTDADGDEGPFTTRADKCASRPATADYLSAAVYNNWSNLYPNVEPCQSCTDQGCVAFTTPENIGYYLCQQQGIYYEPTAVQQNNIITCSCQVIPPQPCGGNNQCPAGQVCNVNTQQCVMDCTSSPCPTGQVCIEQQCITPQCTSNNQCPTGQLCTNYQCVSPTPTPPTTSLVVYLVLGLLSLVFVGLFLWWIERDQAKKKQQQQTALAQVLA